VITPATFRQTFPAFGDPGVYDDAALNFYIPLAYTFLNTPRWGSLLDYGASLWVAHHMVLNARDNATVESGGLPGEVQGVKTSKSVDRGSISYDAVGVSILDGDYWNMTTFGIRFVRLARMMGSGGMQVNGVPCGVGYGPWLGFSGGGGGVW
jgi:hypothetical protein